MANKKYNYHPLRMFKHMDGNQYYASTLFVDELSGTKYYINWGTINEKNVFIPNNLFSSLPDNEKEIFIFPDNWDKSSDKDIKVTKKEFRLAQLKLNICMDYVIPFDHKDIEADDLSYIESGQYFLGLLFRKYYIPSNFVLIFMYINPVSSAIKRSAEMIELLYLKYAPCVKIANMQGLSAAKIISEYLKLVPIQTITDDFREKYIHINLGNKRFRKDFDKLDIVYVTFYTEFKLTADKDDEPSAIVEAIAYTPNLHEPFYYNVFSGDEVTLKIIYSVKSDLSDLFMDDIILLLDKRDAYNDNIIGKLIADNIPFIFIQKNMSKEIYSHISNIEYDKDENPIGMQYCELHKCYGKQIDLSGKEYKCNIYVTPSLRLKDLNKIDSEIKEELELLDEKISSDTLKYEYEEINKELKYHRIDIRQVDGQDIFEIVIKPSKIQRDRDCAGTHGLITYNVDGDADNAINIYKLKMDQDIFFRRIRNLIKHDIKDYDYKNINEEGKRFVLFIALFIHMKILYTYRNSEKLKDCYTLTSMINKMQSLDGIIEKYENIFDGLTEEQKEIFNEFGFHRSDFEYED